MAADGIEQAMNLFIRRWGEMSVTWGITRTMAEVHALLFITSRPLCTDDIMEQLQISRGNASMNLRQLLNWGLIRRTHIRGDRKEYFVSDLDAWQMFETIARERRRREVEPIIETIRRCRESLAERVPELSAEEKVEAMGCDQRLASMLDFVNTMNALLNLVLSTGSKRIESLTKTISRLTKTTPHPSNTVTTDP